MGDTEAFILRFEQELKIFQEQQIFDYPDLKVKIEIMN